MNLIEKAARIAVDAHKTQLRKDDASPYIVHPFMVATILLKHGFRDEVVAAALVHDVIEDTEYPVEKMALELGPDVMHIVRAVTQDDALSWDDKKKNYIETVRAGDAEVKAVATADKIHNAESLLGGHERRGIDIWAHFNAGKDKKLWFENAMLTMLQETWQHPLVDEYAALVARLNALV